MTSDYRPELVQRAFVGFIGARLHPFWSFTVPRLRLIARYQLSEDLIALRFETNRAFNQQAATSNTGWQGGQYLTLRVCIDGVYHQRSYSLVGLAQQPLWWHHDDSPSLKKPRQHTVTIAIKPQGLVSDYLAQDIPFGSIVESSAPTGDFVLAKASMPARVKSHQKTQAPLLFIAGGSGITPMLGLITQALAQGHPVTLLHYHRSAIPPFLSQWQQLDDRYPNFNYHLINTGDPRTYLANSRHLDIDSLLSLNLPLAETMIFACGSPHLLTALYQVATDISVTIGYPLRDNIIVERFGSGLTDPYINKTTDLTAHTVYLRARQRQFSSDTTLLVAAEKADIRLAHGCRQGICQLCRCNKVSGVVKNIQTGRISGDGYEPIQTCLSVALTEIVLDV